MTRNDKIEKTFQSLKQAITAASVIVGGTSTPVQTDANLSLNTMMDEVEYVLNLPEIKASTLAARLTNSANAQKEEAR
jgi:hypothetical protein